MYASYLRFHIEIDNRRKSKTQLYNELDDITFYIVNFPFTTSYIPGAPRNGVSTRYSRAYTHYI